jgi:uncharacterized membrane protein
MRRYRMNRLEAFSDGVFAIAITLLVLEIAVPAGSEDDLLGAIVGEWPSYLAYLVSFATIGAVWVAHSVITEHVESADPPFLRINLLLLFFVSFLPFPTRLLAEYLGHDGAEEAVRVAVTFYGVTLLLTSVTASALWGWARHTHLIHESARDADVRYLTHRLTPGLAGYVAIIIVGVFQPIVAVLGYLVIALFFLVPVRELRASRRAGTSAPGGVDPAS